WYLWIKALHVMSVIAWMAGLLYLPRLFVYHCDAVAGSDQSETLKIMERRLLRAIMNPAMIGTWVFGSMMVVWLAPAGFDGWLHVKLAAVVLMTIFHHMAGRWRKDFLADRNERPQRFYRIMNEVPAVLMVVIVIMVIVKPF
ncbi:MAG: protoporphyrinogen oxidase HemJ, partial [Rhodospirillales bacterium]